MYSKVCWQHPAMFCLYTSNKLIRPLFKFSLKVRRMRLNLSYLLYLLKDKAIFKAVSNIPFDKLANVIKWVHFFCGCNIPFDGGAKFPLLPVTAIQALLLVFLLVHEFLFNNWQLWQNQKRGVHWQASIWFFILYFERIFCVKRVVFRRTKVDFKWFINSKIKWEYM